jgi:hypothetical protein
VGDRQQDLPHGACRLGVAAEAGEGGTTPPNRSVNALAQDVHSHAPPSGPDGRRSGSPQYGQ